MASNALHKVMEQSRENRRRNRWNKVVTGMAAFVVFCTTYALILPAITEEREPLCGLEEHVHTDKCWEKPKALTCPYQKMAEDGTLTLLVHTHDENCCDVQGNLVCTLPQVASHVHDYRCYTDVIPEAPHVHTDACYTEEKTLTCQLPESEGHTHSADCEGEVDVLICQVPESEEHTHGESCYVKTTGYVCGLEESEGHTHTDTCYTLEKKLTCGKTEATEEALAAYTGEPEKVLTCGCDEVILHQHTEECRDEYGNLTCELNELFAHQHGKECWTTVRDPNAEKVLSCGFKEEHTHDDTCYTDLEADLETPEMWEALLPETTGNWSEDLLAVALTQLGYEQSKDNVTVTPEGLVLNYTRYGQWAGTPYGPWSLNFLDFCHHYAGIPADAFPVHEGQLRWCEQRKEENWNIYWTPDQYTPVPGDTVFLDLDVDGTMDAAAIVWELTEATEEAEAALTVIRGDAEGSVQKCEYKPADPVILGYASLAAAKSRWELLNPAPEPEPTRYCGLEQHTHTEECYDEEENLICQLPEHTHNEACLEAPVVYYCGLEEHNHDENCYDNEGTLTCTKEEHTHEALCRVEQKYFCGLEEHTHTDACYGEDNVLTCGKEAHVHADSCRQMPVVLRCGIDEHTHADSCYDEENNLVCTHEEHTHTDACVGRYICGLSEHRHTDECYDEAKNLICTKEEHAHSDVCMVVYQMMKAEINSPFSFFAMLDIGGSVDNVEITLSGEYLPVGGRVMAVPANTGGWDTSLTGKTHWAYEIGIMNAEDALVGSAGPVTVKVKIPAMNTDMRFVAARMVDGKPIALESSKNEANKTVTFQLDSVEENGVTIAVFQVSPNPQQCVDDDCQFNNYLVDADGNANFAECTNTAPFGGASSFNLFLLGNLNGWGQTHGNAAVWGDLLSSNHGVGYDDGSSFDYAGDITAARDISLILGGKPAASGTVTASNGSVLIQDVYDDQTKIDLRGPAGNHFHHVTKEDLDKYFTKAELELTKHNTNMDIYVDKVEQTNDGHYGVARFMSDKNPDDVAMAEGVVKEGYVVLHGENRFYNVFNLPYEMYTSLGTTHEIRPVYMDVPDGSYTIINVLPPKNSTVIDDWRVQLWYRDSDGKFIPQPAKHIAAGVEYDQSQMTLINFDPSITKWEPYGQGEYLYASIMGPNVELDVVGTDIHLQGTIVLKDIIGDTVENSSTIYSPFFTGSALHLNKETLCDSADNGKAHLNTHFDGTVLDNRDPSCDITEAEKEKKTKWANYYADLQFSVTTAPGQPADLASKKHLPLDGEELVVSGLAPGNYQIVDEVVYIEKQDPNAPAGVMMRLTIDKDGYWQRVRYVEAGTEEYRPTMGMDGKLVDGRVWNLSAEHWTLYYCDANGKELILTDPGYGGESRVPESKKVKINSDDEFYTYKHFWNYAAFRDGLNGKEHMSVDIGNNEEVYRYVINHFDLEQKSVRSVIKRWQDPKGHIVTPPNTKIQVALYRMPMAKALEQGSFEKRFDSGYGEQVPNEECGGENPVTFGAEDNWYSMWTDLDPNYFYFISEIDVYPGYTAVQPSWTVEDGKIIWTNFVEDKGLFVLANQQEEADMGNLTVQKVWYNDSGKKLTPAEVSANKDLFSQVTLYRQYGEVYDDDRQAPMVLYVGDRTFDTPKRYFSGSDVEVRVTFFVKGQFAVDNQNPHGTDKIRLQYDGKTYDAKPVLEAYAYNNVVGDQNYYHRMTITVQLNGITNTAFSPGKLVLVPSKDESAYPIVVENDAGSIGLELDAAQGSPISGKLRIAYPSFEIKELKIPDYWIDWKNIEVAPVSDSVVTLQEPETVDPDKEYWMHVWEDLPAFDPDNELIRYRYYALETAVTDNAYTPNYVYYENDQHFGNLKYTELTANNIIGVNAGYIVVHNHPAPKGGPELPMTGGIGTIPYTLGGLLTVILAGFLMQYNLKKRRKEDFSL